MNTMKRIISILLCMAMLCAMGCSAIGETESAGNTFSFGCFGYRVPFLTGTEQKDDTTTVHSTMMGSYTVTALHLEAPMADALAASAAATDILGMEVSLSEDEKGAYSAMFQGDYSYYLVLVKGDTFLSFAVTNPHYLSLLHKQLVVLPESSYTEAPMQDETVVIPAHLPYEYALKGMGVAIDDVKTAMSAMLTQGELRVAWDPAVAIDETYSCVTAYVQALGVCVSFVYETATSEVVSAQWYKFLYAGTGNGDLYTEAISSGQTGAAVYTALFFAKCGLEMSTFGARMPELEQSFTELKSWLDAVSTEALNLDDVFDSSTLIIDSLLAMHIESDKGSGLGNVVHACLTAMN